MIGTTLPRIYLAGPDLFYPNVVARYDALKALCAKHGLVGVAPTDGCPPIPAGQSQPDAALIYRHDIALLQSCDAVLANIAPFNGPLEPDSGTAYEMGFAAACGMPVVSYCTDGLDTRTRTLRAGRLIDAQGRNDDGLLVEDFGMPANLMLCAEHASFTTPEQAAEHLASVLREFNPRVSPKDAQRQVQDDLVTLVMRLSRDLRKAQEGSDKPSSLPTRATDYLQRKGLLGSPFRTDGVAPGSDRAPTDLIDAITAYGDARADGDIDLGGKRLAECVLIARSRLAD